MRVDRAVEDHAEQLACSPNGGDGVIAFVEGVEPVTDISAGDGGELLLTEGWLHIAFVSVCVVRKSDGSNLVPFDRL